MCIQGQREVTAVFKRDGGESHLMLKVMEIWMVVWWAHSEYCSHQIPPAPVSERLQVERRLLAHLCSLGLGKGLVSHLGIETEDRPE